MSESGRMGGESFLFKGMIMPFMGERTRGLGTATKMAY